MKAHQKQPRPVSHTIQHKTKAANQAPIQKILQRYRNKTVQRAENLEEDDELLQGKFEKTAQRMDLEEEEEPLQGKFEVTQREETDHSSFLTPHSSLNNTGLPDDLKSGVENLSGYNMDDVRVHYNSSKPAQLQALAYTQGSDIHVAPGREKHLPHEAWHVVQQKQGRVQPTLQLQGINVNDDERLEQEADAMGAQAARGNVLQQYAITGSRTGGNGCVQRKEFHLFNEVVPGINELGIAIANPYVKDLGNVAGGRANVFFEIAKYAGEEVGEAINAILSTQANYKTNAAKLYPVFLKDHETKYYFKLEKNDPPIPGQYNPQGDNWLDVPNNRLKEFKLDAFQVSVQATDTVNANKVMKLTYNYKKDACGYIVKIDDNGNTAHMEGYPGGGTEYDSGHEHGAIDDQKILDHTNAVQDILIIKKRKYDAYTKLAGEGARFMCVRDNITSLTNNTKFSARNSHDTLFYSINFKNLWGKWDSWFNKKFNIEDREVGNIIINKKLGEKAPEIEETLNKPMGSVRLM